MTTATWLVCERCGSAAGWNYLYNRERNEWEVVKGGPLCRSCADYYLPRQGRDYD